MCANSPWTVSINRSKSCTATQRDFPVPDNNYGLWRKENQQPKACFETCYRRDMGGRTGNSELAIFQFLLTTVLASVIKARQTPTLTYNHPHNSSQTISQTSTTLRPQLGRLSYNNH